MPWLSLLSIVVWSVFCRRRHRRQLLIHPRNCFFSVPDFIQDTFLSFCDCYFYLNFPVTLFQTNSFFSSLLPSPTSFHYIICLIITVNRFQTSSVFSSLLLLPKSYHHMIRLIVTVNIDYLLFTEHLIFTMTSFSPSLHFRHHTCYLLFIKRLIVTMT